MHLVPVYWLNLNSLHPHVKAFFLPQTAPLFLPPLRWEPGCHCRLHFTFSWNNVTGLHVSTCKTFFISLSLPVMIIAAPFPLVFQTSLSLNSPEYFSLHYLHNFVHWSHPIFQHLYWFPVHFHTELPDSPSHLQSGLQPPSYICALL